MLFQDKVVVVTGGAQGIGKCCAECFAREGAIVHVIDIQQGACLLCMQSTDTSSEEEQEEIQLPLSV